MCKLRQNTQKIANFLRYYGKIHSKLPIFRVKSVKIYTSQTKFTWIYSWRSWQIWGMNMNFWIENDRAIQLSSSKEWTKIDSLNKNLFNYQPLWITISSKRHKGSSCYSSFLPLIEQYTIAKWPNFVKPKIWRNLLPISAFCETWIPASRQRIAGC